MIWLWLASLEACICSGDPASFQQKNILLTLFCIEEDKGEEDVEVEKLGQWLAASLEKGSGGVDR